MVVAAVQSNNSSSALDDDDDDDDVLVAIGIALVAAVVLVDDGNLKYMLPLFSCFSRSRCDV